MNLPHLRARLIDSGYINDKEKCDIVAVRRMLSDRFEKIDYHQAREDVIPFIRDSSVTDLWSADFFKQITEKLSV